MISNDPVLATYSGIIQGFFWTFSDDSSSILFREPDELILLDRQDRVTWNRETFLRVFAELDDGPICILNLLDEPDPTWIIYCTEYDDCPDDNEWAALGLQYASEVLDELYPG